MCRLIGMHGHMWTRFVTMFSKMASPTTTKALVLEKSTEDKSPIYHDACIIDRPIPPLKGSEILVRMEAVAFNHRDVGTLILC